MNIRKFYQIKIRQTCESLAQKYKNNLSRNTFVTWKTYFNLMFLLKDLDKSKEALLIPINTKSKCKS